MIRLPGVDPIVVGKGLLSVVVAGLLGGCHAGQMGRVVKPSTWEAAPQAIAAIFADQPDRVLTMDAIAPGSAYRFDPSEKDRQFASKDRSLRFRHVGMSLCDRMPSGTVLVDMAFVDGQGSRVVAESVNLLRLTPTLDCTGEMQYPEMLLEEYGRFGVSFRREHGEFRIELADVTDRTVVDATGRAHRLGIWNNCLDPTKWEMVLDAEDYSNFSQRLNGELYINQNRTLARSWFYLDANLYAALVRVKNPHLSVDPLLDYEELSKRAEQTVPDLDALRTIRHRVPSTTVEIGHQSRRRLVALDVEQYHKWQQGLVINRESFETYDDVLAQPVILASFTGRGFYQLEHPKQFDFGWLRALDEVVIDTLEVSTSDCYIQVTLTGMNVPYTVVVGNIDMALLSEQKLFGMPFGFNPFPKTRRHDPAQDTIHYEADRMPDHIKPYAMLLDHGTGHWINNQKKGLEKVYMGWESMDRKVLVVYLGSYERIMPVWVARIQLDDETVDRVRVRRQLYAY